MRRHLKTRIALGFIMTMAGVAWAGGSNYGIAPGARPDMAGKISEWPVPTPKFARDRPPGRTGTSTSR